MLPLLCFEGAHSDFGLITLLITDQPGLQIATEDGWTDIHLEPNCIVVNLGDELQRQVNESLQFALDAHYSFFNASSNPESRLELVRIDSGSILSDVI